MNLFESFDEVINEEFIEKFTSYTSETHGDTRATLQGVFYILLAGMLRKSNSDMSAGMLFNQIQDNLKKIDLPTNLASIFSQEALIKKIENDGNKIISQTFPAYKSPLLSMVSTYSGSSKTTTTLAAYIVANVTMNLFKKDSESPNWTKEQLITQLRGIHPMLIERIPDKLIEKMVPSLALHDLMGEKYFEIKRDKGEAGTTGKIKIDEAAPITPQIDYSDAFKEETSSKSWLVALIVGFLAIGGIVYYFYNQEEGFNFFSKKEIPVESIDPELEAVLNSDSTSTEQPEAPKTPADYVQFREYVQNANEKGGKEFEIKSIKFVTSSKDVDTESHALVDSISTLMKANSNLQLKISALSTSGDITLNRKRAFELKGMLQARGIDPIKLDAVSGGLGDDNIKLKVISK